MVTLSIPIRLFAELKSQQFNKFVPIMFLDWCFTMLTSRLVYKWYFEESHVMVVCIFVCRTLKAAGARGMHTVLLASHINMVALHIQLGFEDVTDKNAPDDMLVLGMKL